MSTPMLYREMMSQHILVTGAPGSGKSLLTQHAVLRWVSGQSALGRTPIGQVRTLHLDYSQGSTLTRLRYQRLARGLSLDLGALPDSALALAFSPKLHLDDSDAEMVLRQTLADAEATVLVIDCIEAACRHPNPPTLRKAHQLIRRVCDDQCMCVVIQSDADVTDGFNRGFQIVRLEEDPHDPKHKLVYWEDDVA